MTITLTYKGNFNGSPVFNLYNSVNGATGQVAQFTHNGNVCYSLLATNPDTKKTLPLGHPLWDKWSGATATLKLPHVYFEQYGKWWLQVGTNTPVCKSDNTTTWQTWYVHPWYVHYHYPSITTIGVFKYWP
jgi:hypothetical protein